MPAPAQTFASLAARWEGAGRAERRAPPARRLHARVRPHRKPLRAGRLVADLLGLTQGGYRIVDG